jgi:hypothetical protein
MKIFGEEHFIDNTMVEILEDYNNKFENRVLDEMTKTIKYVIPEIKVNAEKLKNWVIFCSRLESIDKSDLIDIAVEKKFAEKDKELELYKKALELACEKYIGVDGISYVIRDSVDYWGKSDEQVLKETIDYFLNEAKS